MPKETMTPVERWLAVLRRERPDRLPMDYWATAETTRNLMAHLGSSTEEEMLALLHIDRPLTVTPRYVGPPVAADRDVFGCGFKLVSYGAGAYRECVYHPLAQYESVEQIEAGYVWPSPDWWDYRDIPRLVENGASRPIRGGGSEPFLLYKHLRGQEQAFIDLIEHPDIVHYCLDKLFDLAYQNTLRIFDSVPGRVHISYVAEDLGGQQDLLFSPAQIRTFLLPRMRRMIELVHGAGAYVFHHTDGAVRKILPDLLEAGIDVLNPVQWRCAGMEREGLKRDYGRRVVFHGGVDNQRTLAFGSAEDVREEVVENIRVLGAGGGYILAPCHNIQAVSPPENIVAMYETGLEAGWS